jgi:hypothetical protein
VETSYRWTGDAKFHTIEAVGSKEHVLVFFGTAIQSVGLWRIIAASGLSDQPSGTWMKEFLQNATMLY